MYWRNLQLRAQRVQFIFSEITLGTAAPVVDTSGDNFHRRTLCHLKLSLAQHFDRCRPLHTAAASHVSQQSDPMRHGKLLESTSHTHTRTHAQRPVVLSARTQSATQLLHNDVRFHLTSPVTVPCFVFLLN